MRGNTFTEVSKLFWVGTKERHFIEDELLALVSRVFWVEVFCALFALGTIWCCYISQTWCWWDLEANCVSCYLWKRGGDEQVVESAFLFWVTSVHSCSSTPTHLFGHTIIFLQNIFLVTNQRSLREFAPFPQYFPPMFSSFISTACSHKTRQRDREYYLLLILWLVLNFQVFS